MRVVVRIAVALGVRRLPCVVVRRGVTGRVVGVTGVAPRVMGCIRRRRVARRVRRMARVGRGIMRAGVERSEVRPWPAWESAAEAAHGRARRRIVNEALRPAEATRDWRTQILALRAEAGASGADPIAAGLSGLTLLEARAEEEAASAIALLMREALETPGRTAALITPDQALARRVSARLARWRVEADTSAGRPLAETPIGTLLGLAAEAVAQGFDPPTLLALLKHPLVDLANGKAAALRTLERRGLRGPRPRGWSGLRARLAGTGAVMGEHGARAASILRRR